MNPTSWNDLLVKQELGQGMGISMQQSVGQQQSVNATNPGMYSSGVSETDQTGMLINPNGLNGQMGHPLMNNVATAMMMHQQPGNRTSRLSDEINNNDDMMDDDDTMDNDDDDCNSSVNNDAEGVWSPDIEQSFQVIGTPIFASVL